MDGFHGSWILRIILGFVVALGWLIVQGCWAWTSIVAQGRDLSLVSPRNHLCVSAKRISPGANVNLCPCQGPEYPNQRWFHDPTAGSLSVSFDSGKHGSLCLDAVLTSYNGSRNTTFLLVLASCTGLTSQKWDYKQQRFQYGPSELTGGRTLFLQGSPSFDCTEKMTAGDIAPEMDFKMVAPPGPIGHPFYEKIGAGDEYVQSFSLRHRFLRPGEEGKGPSYLEAHKEDLVASLAAAAGLGWALAITFFFLLWYTWRKYRTQKSTELTRLIEKSGPFPSRSAADFDAPRVRHYGLREIENATDNFTSLVGKEDFWETYLARFPDQGMVVVTREIPSREYEPAFKSQISSIAKIQHHCLVDLLGFCDENGEHMIVFEYLPRGTLYDRLNFSKGAAPLTWVHRMHIAYDMASGLEHLHQYVNPPIVHGNFKSSRIYLGENYSTKVADWCLLRLRRQDALASNLQWAKFNNTLGFPESPNACGIKNDVYNFGLLLLELLSGVQESEVMSLWAEKFASQQEHLSLVDPLLGKDVDLVELHAVVEVAKMCVNNLERRRPCMFEVERIFKEKLWRSLKDPACEITKK